MYFKENCFDQKIGKLSQKIQSLKFHHNVLLIYSFHCQEPIKKTIFKQLDEQFQRERLQSQNVTKK